MDSKRTMLLYLTPEQEGRVAPDTRVILLNAATRQLKELWPGDAIPAVDNSHLHIYTVPTTPVEAVFAMQDAIRCTAPSGALVRPGFCFRVRLRYISPMGLRALLTAPLDRGEQPPECITLEDLYNTLRKPMQAACLKAAEQFSGGQTLSYTHWWQEFQSGSAFAGQLASALVPVFNSHGFRLDAESVAVKGLAGIPV